MRALGYPIDVTIDGCGDLGEAVRRLECKPGNGLLVVKMLYAWNVG